MAGVLRGRQVSGRARFFDVYSPITYKREAAKLALRGDALTWRCW